MIKVQSTNIGEAIKLLRESKGMTRAELSEAAGISESHLKKLRQIGRASCRERVFVHV